MSANTKNEDDEERRRTYDLASLAGDLAHESAREGIRIPFVGVPLLLELTLRGGGGGATRSARLLFGLAGLLRGESLLLVQNGHQVVQQLLGVLQNTEVSPHTRESPAVCVCVVLYRYARVRNRREGGERAAGTYVLALRESVL